MGNSLNIMGTLTGKLIHRVSPLRLFFCLALAGWMLQACTPESENPDTPKGYEWYPVALGNEQVYAVDSITFRFDGSRLFRDTASLQARELVSEMTVNDNGDSLFLIERYERYHTGEPWQIRKVFAMHRSDRQAFQTEDNLRLIKLVFPFRRGTAWQSTLFIDPARRVTVNGETIEMFKGWQSSILTTDTSYVHGQIALDSAMLVVHADVENLIERRWVQEMYVPEIGLVFQQQYILDTQCRSCCNGDFGLCESISWPEKAEKGFIVSKRLLEWD